MGCGLAGLSPKISQKYFNRGLIFPLDCMEQEVELPNKIKILFPLLVLFAGLALYIGWAAMYDAWTDIGLYAISVPMIGFGLAGIFLFTRKEPEEEED
jgi:hypothetical protein